MPILLLQNKFVKLNSGDRVTATGKVNLLHVMCYYVLSNTETVQFVDMYKLQTVILNKLTGTSCISVISPLYCALLICHVEPAVTCEILPLFLFTCCICIRFVLSQTWQTLTKFIEKSNNIYNTKFVSLNPP